MMPDLISHPSPNAGERPAGAGPDMLVFHYTGMESGRQALDRLCDPDAAVSAHYVVEEDGRVFELVDPWRRAWHAGISSWQGREGLNDFSIGIEIVNPGHEYGYRPFPDSQMQSVLDLSRNLLKRFDISARHIVGHSDIAPDRKQDPGEYFPWAWLARNGVGIFPDNPPATDPEGDLFVACRRHLAAAGYDGARNASSLDDLKSYIIAFQRHWVQGAVSGEACAMTMSMLKAVSKAMMEEGYIQQ